MASYFVTGDRCVLEPGLLDEGDLRANPENLPAISPEELLRRVHDDPTPRFPFPPDAAPLGEHLRTLTNAAHRTNDLALLVAYAVIRDADDAVLVRTWRCDERRSWRSIAREAHGALTGRPVSPPWSPPENQLFGRALCVVAAEVLGEDPFTAPWN